VNSSTTADCYPISVAPGQSRLFLDYCAGAETVRPFYGSIPALYGADSVSSERWQARRSVPAHWPELVRLLAAQNSAPAAAPALAQLREGAGTVVTGQQVGLFGGPMFTPLKAATAIARARQATAAGHPHVAVFWLASEDHDFAEVDHVIFPAAKELRKLAYTPSLAPASAIPVGSIVLDDSIQPLVDQAWDVIGPSDATDALAEAYKPGRTLAEAFAGLYSKVFAAQGLLILDASGRDFHRLGAPVLRAGLERADELHAALLERNRSLQASGYAAQVAVSSHSSLLFLVDGRTGARLALKRTPPSAQEPGGLWQAGRQSYSTGELLGVLDAEPERISPSALLRPVFQDFLLSTSAIVGGPAEIAYFAQSAVLYERILGWQTPAFTRLSATLVEPAVGELLRRHELTIDRIFGQSPDSLAQLLAARAMSIEGKRKLAAAGQALDAELAPLLGWMHSLDEGLGRSAETAASKMRYQMNRLRRLAANFQLQREASLVRHAQTICQSIFPGGAMQERVHGAAYYFARYGFELAETLAAQAEHACPGHLAIWL